MITMEMRNGTWSITGRISRNALLSARVTDVSREIVHTLQGKGYQVAIATNPIFPRIATWSRLAWLGLSAGEFPLVTTFENSHFAKPNPRYYLEVCEKLGVRPKTV